VSDSPSRSDRPYDRAWIGALVLVAVGYFVAGKAGLLLAYPNASVSAVWPATGVAIAALVLGGYRLWPAVAVGAFLVNFTTTGDPASSASIAAGNTLEGLVGAYLTFRLAGGAAAADSPRGVVSFALLACLPAAAVAALVGASTLEVAGLATPATFPTTAATWWLGDAVGGIEVGLLVLVIASARRGTPLRLPRHWPLEGAVLGVVTGALMVYVFTGAPAVLVAGTALHGTIFLLLPPLVWAAFRFGPVGAVTFSSALSVVAILATVSGIGPFATLPRADALLALRIFMASVVVTGMLVGTERLQRGLLEDELGEARRALERRVQERTSVLANAQSISHLGSWEYDLRTRRVTWSDEMFRIYGFGEERFPVTFERAIEVVEPEDRAAIIADMEEMGRSNDPVHFRFPVRKYRIRLPSGEVRTVEGRGAIGAVENGRVVRLAGTVWDVTDRDRMVDALEKREVELVRSNRDLEQFAYAASHDLQEPLSTIEGYGRLLAERYGGRLDSEGTEFLAQLRSATARMRGLIDDLLDFGRVDQRRFPFSAVSTEAALDETLALLRASVDRSGARVVRETPLPAVWGDRDQVVRLFENLLSNAVKFRGPETPLIRVRARPAGELIEFAVQDNGIGVPPEFREQIFEMFRRLYTRSQYPGNGMGLAIAKRIVEAHGGTIWVESTGRAGEGATFRFTLPPARPEEATTPVAPSSAEVAAARR
jgi:signal transduction histidine kinase/integral membrane sensor domain MASE1